MCAKFIKFLLLHFQFGAESLICQCVHSVVQVLLLFTCSLLVPISSKVRILHLEIQGLQVIVLGYFERMAMKITLVESNTKKLH